MLRSRHLLLAFARVGPMLILWTLAWGEPASDEAQAVPVDPTFGRAGQRPEPHWYARLDGLGEGVPVSPRWSRRDRSTYRVWSFEDGVVQRAWKRSRGVVEEEHLYDLRGWPTLTVAYEDEQPTVGTVHLASPVEMPFEGFTQQSVTGAQLFAPAPPSGDGFDLGGGRFQVRTEPGGVDVQAPDYPERWLTDCGCVLDERQPAWVDGEPGVRLRLRTLSVEKPDVAYVWAVPRGDVTWIASYRVQDSEHPDADLAPGRLVLSTLRWNEPDPEGDSE